MRAFVGFGEAFYERGWKERLKLGRKKGILTKTFSIADAQAAEGSWPVSAIKVTET